MARGGLPGGAEGAARKMDLVMGERPAEPKLPPVGEKLETLSPQTVARAELPPAAAPPPPEPLAGKPPLPPQASRPLLLGIPAHGLAWSQDGRIRLGAFTPAGTEPWQRLWGMDTPVVVPARDQAPAWARSSSVRGVVSHVNPSRPK